MNPVIIQRDSTQATHYVRIGEFYVRAGVLPALCGCMQVRQRDVKAGIMRRASGEVATCGRCVKLAEKHPYFVLTEPVAS